MAYLAVFGTPTSLTGQSLSTTVGLLLGTITNTTRIRKLVINIDVTGIVGGGDYIAYLTIARTGGANELESIRTTKTAGAGVTKITLSTIPLILNSATDVIRVYLLGLAGDAATGTVATTVTAIEEFIYADASGRVDLVDAPNATAIQAWDTELSGVHGAGAWGPIGASGSFTITLTVTDSATSNPLQGVLVTTKDASDAATLDQQRTNAAGVVTIALDAATYKIHLSSIPGYSSAVNTLVVTANASVGYTITPITIGTPATPNLCRVYGYEYLNGSAVVGRIAKARLLNLPQSTTTVVLEGVWSESTSDANGLWYFDVVIGKTYHFMIDQAGVNVSLVVPDQSSYDLRSAL
jgi:hypothetical protein